MKKKKSNTPRHKRMKRASRLQAATHWIPKYTGRNIVQGYSRHFAVDKLCAIKELEILGYKFEANYVKQLEESMEGQQKIRQRRKIQKEQEKDLDLDDTFYYIAGYTSGGAPYGVTWEEMDLDPYSEKSEEPLRNKEISLFGYDDILF